MTAPALRGQAIDDRYLRDWSGLVGGSPAEVHRPGDTAEVAAIVRRCAAEGRRITVQGGMTGLAGGAVPDAGDVVINLERMNTIEEIDALEGVMRVQAGATLQSVQEAAAAAGWQFAVDLGARGSCQVGGNASTNAGGTRVLRYGTMREAVLGVEAVLADGTVVESLSRLVKNSSGLDPRFLFIGSEGTLGIITRLVLRLHPPTGQPAAAWVALDRFDALPRLLRALRRQLGSALQAFEFMSGRFVDLASSLTGQPAPMGSAARWHVLVEAAGMPGTSMDEALQDVLAAAMEAGDVRDAALAASETHRAAFWRLRESIPEVIGHLKPIVPLDVSIPWSQTETWMSEVEAALERELPQATHLFLGHLGDNNVHLISGPVDAQGLHRVDEIAYGALRGRGGSISAEHGIGRMKKPWLGATRTAGELALMRRLKHAMDPHGLLNPGRIID